MISLLLAAALGGQPACQAATGHGYAAQYVATPFVQSNYQTQSYAGYSPTYQYRIVTAFVPIQQYERTEIVGDQARAQQFAQQRLQADTSLAQAIVGMSTELKSFREQVAQATKVQDQAFQQRQAPPVAQYPVQPSPQSPPPPSKSVPDDGRVPPPPQASPQDPAKGFPASPPAELPATPTDAVQGDPGAFPTQPQPVPFRAPQASSGPLSPAMQSATQVVGARCGSCHGPNGSGGLTLLSSKDRLASYAPDFLRMLDQVAYRGYVLKSDGTKLKMPPGGRSLSQEEWATIHAALDTAEQEAALASNSGPR